MVELLLHIVIPLLILYAFKPNLNKKLVYGLLILTITPDLDFFLNSGHRNTFHNLLFVLIMSLLVYLLFRFVINSKNPKKETENKNAFYLSTFYLFSHLLLDLKYPGIPFFQPFYNKNISIIYHLFMVKDRLLFGPECEVRYYFLSVTAVLIVLLIFAVILARWWKKKKSP